MVYRLKERMVINMASGSNTFGGTVKLSGETEYRKALSNISAQLGVVSSELNKVSTQ